MRKMDKRRKHHNVKRQRSLKIYVALLIVALMAFALLIEFKPANNIKPCSPNACNNTVQSKTSSPLLNVTSGILDFNFTYYGIVAQNSTIYNGTLYNVRFLCANSTASNSINQNPNPGLGYGYTYPYIQLGQSITVSLLCYNNEAVPLNVSDVGSHFTAWIEYSMYRINGPNEISRINLTST